MIRATKATRRLATAQRRPRRSRTGHRGQPSPWRPAGTAGAATGSPAPHTELCYLIDLYHRAEPDSAARFRLHEQIEEQLPW